MSAVSPVAHPFRAAAGLLALALLLLATIVVPSAHPARRPAAPLPALEREVIGAINAVRVAHGLSALRPSPELAAAAAAHSRDMVLHGYFGHTSWNGTTFDERIAEFYPDPATVQRWTVGENIVWRAPALDAARALRMWMASPEHRRNILDPVWRQIGVSAVRTWRAPGTFEGHDATVITTDFGTRSR